MTTNERLSEANRVLRELTGREPYYADIYEYARNEVFRMKCKKELQAKRLG